jgi:hypothetical protein
MFRDTSVNVMIFNPLADLSMNLAFPSYIFELIALYRLLMYCYADF